MSKPVAIITGAASGIGLALSKHLLDQNWRVVMADTNAATGGPLAESFGPDALFIKTDVSVYSQQVNLFAKAFAWGNHSISFFAANAGIGDTKSLYSHEEELDEKGFPKPLDLQTLRVDLDSVFQGIWLFKHFVRRNEGPKVGKVVITSSMAGIYPMQTNPLYTTAKHGLIGLARAAGASFLHEGITVNCICPAFVLTGLAPQEIIDKFPKEHITPMSTVIRAYDMFLEDSSMSGKVVELSLDQIYMREPPSFSTESNRWLNKFTMDWD